MKRSRSDVLEGPVRQEYIKTLVKEYGYPIEHIGVEVPIQGFCDSNYGKADIVVYQSDRKRYDEIYIIVECKRQDKREGEQQVKSYGSHTTAEIVILHNGSTPTLYWQRLKTQNRYLSQSYLPVFGKFFDEKKEENRKTIKGCGSVAFRITELKKSLIDRCNECLQSGGVESLEDAKRYLVALREITVIEDQPSFSQVLALLSNRRYGFDINEDEFLQIEEEDNHTDDEE